MTRADSCLAFLSRAGWDKAERQPIPGDASFRRYERLIKPDGARALLMDAPPPRENVRPFLAVDAALRARGLNAPEIYAQDEEQGFLILEDFGDGSFTRQIAADPACEETLYRAAVELLAALHETPPPQGLPEWRGETMLRAIDATLFDWYWPEAKGDAPQAHARASLHDALRPLLAQAELGQSAFVLRDYHADNLFWLPERAGHGRVGLIDFQDAGVGSPCYDLVSLLHDVRRAVNPAMAERLKAHYARLRGLDADEFSAACAIISAQRNIRITALWVRLLRRDHRPGYLKFLGRNWDLLERDLAHPVLAPVRRWFDEHFPAALRHPLAARLMAEATA